MRVRRTDANGFSLVEVIIAMLMLGIIAIALMPVLWQGIRFSSDQSATATATRHLNAVIEQARPDATCASLVDLASSPPAIADGSGAALGVSAEVTVYEDRGAGPSEYTVDLARCASSTPTALNDVTLDFTIRMTDGSRAITSITAVVFVK